MRALGADVTGTAMARCNPNIPISMSGRGLTALESIEA